MITPVSPKMYNLNFGSNSIVKTNGKFGNQRTLVNINGNEYEYNHNQHVSNYTFFFRDILAAPFDKNHKGWERLFDVILKNLPKDEKINFYDIACSDGSEAYSVIMTLNERLGEEEAKRFYPIHATDCDGNIIQNAKKYVFASKSDIDNIRYYTSENLDTYFKKQKAEGDEYNYGYKLKPKNTLRDFVEFEQKDILDALDIQTENNVIMCRNVWPYLDAEKFTKAIEKLKQMPKSTIVVIGEYDICSANKTFMPIVLQDAGYYPLYHGSVLAYKKAD